MFREVQALAANDGAEGWESHEAIAGRYEIQQCLAAGGMGEVFAVSDKSTGRRVALKRLLAGRGARLVSMFEREYHTLASLKHPRIIEVYEYGIDHGRPYYTMELLDGQDLRELSPLPYRQACHYLRDVASSLALLHARRMLHRDVSPRNVRVKSDDRCKLIDFGAVSSFGIIDVIIGTPPYVAPEVLQRAPLDQRADLFALGALSYFLLTGEQAFPARTLHQLPELWRTPPAAPSVVLSRSGREPHEPIPQALDELVLSLLLPDRLARPSSAVEVIDRLNSIAALPAEQEALSARSYLHGTPTVGRSREQKKLQKRLTQTLQGKGASVVLEAVAGMGATRLVSQLALDAQLAGAVSIMVDAELHREVYGVAKAVVDMVRCTIPEGADAASPEHFSLLSEFLPQSASTAQEALSAGPWPSGELRGRTQHALTCWLCEVSKLRPMLIAIDNAHHADEASAALLATLARLCREHPLLLVTTRKPNQPAVSPSAIRGIEEASASFTLRGLSRDHIEKLIAAVFGGALHTERLSEWLHHLTGGNPQACMELIHHLVDTGEIRFKEGVWVLPQEPQASDLNESVDLLLSARLARLPADARRLAEALCTHRGPLSIERCLGVAAFEHIAQPHIALQELAQQEVLTQSSTAYHFVHETLREHLYNRLDPQRRRALHRHFGKLLQKQRDLDNNGKLDAGWHLMHGGAEDEGAELLGEAAASLVDNTDELAAAVPALAAALAVFRKQKRSKRQLIRFLAPLAMGGYRVDRKLAAQYGEETTEVFCDLIGLLLAERLRPFLGTHLSVYLGLATGAVRAFFAHGYKAPRAFVGLIMQFMTTMTMLTGTATICLDASRARFFCKRVEPLARALGKKHPAFAAYDFMSTLARLPEDQCAEVTAGCQRVLARVENPHDVVHRQIPPGMISLLHGGAYYAMAAMAAFCDGPMALHYADKLEALGLQLYAMAAEQIKVQYYAMRGDLAATKRHHQRLEILAIQAGSGWQVEVWSPCAMILAYHLTRDVIGIKRIVEELAHLHVEVPSLRYHYELAQCVYHDLQNDLEAAYAARERVLKAHKNRGIIGWSPAVADHTMTLLALGRPQQAKELAQSALATMTEADEPFIAMYQRLHANMALVEATLGDYEAATQRLDRLLDKHRPQAGPVTMGNLHETRARVALMMKAVAEAQLHLKEMERWFRPTGNPALIAQCARLRRDIERGGTGGERTSRPTDPASPAAKDEDTKTLRSVLSQCAGPQERLNRALDLLVTRARAVRGYLYFYRCESDRADLVAPLHGGEIPAGIEEAALRMIRTFRDADPQTTAMTYRSTLTANNNDETPGTSAPYRVFPLIVSHKKQQTVLGAVAVVEGDNPLLSPGAHLLETVALALYEAGDDERATLLPHPPINRDQTPP